MQLGDQILLSKDQLELLKMLHNHLNILLLIYTRIQYKYNLDTVRDQIYNNIRDNRNNTTQKISIGVNEILDKNIGKHDKQTDYGYNIKGYRREFNKYHTSKKLILYPESDINELLDNLETQVIQKRFNDMAEHEGSSNHRSLYFETVYLNFPKINNRGVRSYIEKYNPLI